MTATPGRRPFASLARALVPQLSSDTEALQELVGFDDPDVAVGLVGRWRRRHVGALVVVDQLEFFTLSAPVAVFRGAAAVKAPPFEPLKRIWSSRGEERLQWAQGKRETPRSHP